MKSLILKQTITTPGIIFDYDNSNFSLEGCSRPEDVRTFFIPIIDWLTEFKEGVEKGVINNDKSDPIVFNFKFDYFNSSSAKFILDILVLINDAHKAGLNIRIEWCYEDNDEDMKEVGEELSDVVDFPFEYKVI
jgi:hypothetical protein